MSVAKDSKATVIANEWLGSFVKLGKINESLIADSDVDFEAALIGERKLLSSFLDVAKDSGFVESWQDLFQNDIKIVELLLKQ